MAGSQIEHLEAVAILREVEALRRRTRAALWSAWFPPIVFGGLMLLSLSLWDASRRSRALYWLGAGAVGFALVYLHHRRRQDDVGVAGRARSEVVAAVVVFAVAFLASTGIGGTGRLFGLVDVPIGWGLPRLGIVFLPPLGPPLAFALGYLVLARMERSPAIGGVAICIALAIAVGGMAIQTVYLHPATVMASHPGTIGYTSYTRSVLAFLILPTLTYGVAFLVTGAAFRFIDGRGR